MKIRTLIPVYVLILGLVLVLTYLGGEMVTTMAEGEIPSGRTCMVIDAGHGGIDGGATSCSGVLESQINLQIAKRLEAMVQLLGYDTVMTRTTDTSIHTEGRSIAAQKVSDLKNRVALVDSTEGAILISIHQNTFPDPKYSGTQVFYATDPSSIGLAKLLQENCIRHLGQDNKRSCKPAKDIYLMEHIHRPGVLIECGFLSNPDEDRMLNDPEYQKKLVAVIAGTLSVVTEEAPLRS